MNRSQQICSFLHDLLLSLMYENFDERIKLHIINLLNHAFNISEDNITFHLTPNGFTSITVRFYNEIGIPMSINVHRFNSNPPLKLLDKFKFFK